MRKSNLFKSMELWLNGTSPYPEEPKTEREIMLDGFMAGDHAIVELNGRWYPLPDEDAEGFAEMFDGVILFL